MSQTSLHKPAPSIALRFIICHLSITSARLQFLSQQDQVCFPKRLPPLVSLLEQDPGKNKPAVHPGFALQDLRRSPAFRDTKLEMVPDFHCWIEAPRTLFSLYLLVSTQPEAFIPPSGCRWIELPDSWSLLPLQRDLLRKAYECLLT